MFFNGSIFAVPTQKIAVQRNANVVIEALGDKPINKYASSEAGKLRDVLLNKGLAVTSIKRMFGSIKAIINLAMAEHGIEGRNPFSSIYMPDEVQEERQPIPLDAIRRIQPGSKTIFEAFMSPSLTTETCAFGGVLISSAFSKDFAYMLVIFCSFLTHN